MFRSLKNKFGFQKGWFKKKSVKDFSAIIGSNLALRPIQLAKSFLVAKFLGPADYGILKSAELIRMLDKFGNLGFKQVAVREIGVLKDQNQPEREREIRETAYTSEVILSCILALMGIVISLFLSNKYVWIIILASLGLLASKIQSIYSTEATLQRKFTLIAKITFMSGLLVSILIASTVPFLKIYASLAMPVIVAAVTILYYRDRLKFGFRFRINKQELLRQLKIGIPLSLNSISYGTYIYVERIVILSYLGVVNLGYFGFASMLMGVFKNIFLSAIRVRKMNILEYLGKGHYAKVNSMVIKETALLVLGTLLIIPLVSVAVGFFVPLFLDKFIAAIEISYIFLFVLPFIALGSYVAIVVVSPVVNKQGLVPFFQLGSTLLLFLCTYILHKQDLLSLKNFVMIDVLGYAFMQITYVVLYYLFFYRKFYLPAKNNTPQK